MLRGIEIYKGKRIFYGMGSLFWQVGGPQWWPDAWYDGVVAVGKYREGHESEIQLHPISLQDQPGQTRPRSLQGTPQLASGGTAHRILENLRRMSAQYGTKIAIDGDMGIIRIGAEGSPES